MYLLGIFCVSDIHVYTGVGCQAQRGADLHYGFRKRKGLFQDHMSMISKRRVESPPKFNKYAQGEKKFNKAGMEPEKYIPLIRNPIGTAC